MPQGPPGFEEFFKCYHPTVCRYLLWREAEQSVLEDAAQLTMLAAYRYWERVGGMKDPRGWLFKVAGQRLEDARQARRRQGLLLDAATLRDRIAAQDEVAACDLRLDIIHAVRKLPARQQEALVMRLQFGMEYEEIAQAMEAAPVTARSHVHAGRKTLRAILGDADGEGDRG
ncbi:sigma-70 family RNA polymerase sigma factor [Streptomyces sp. NPDC046925]|uniref:RNA polymerase sigma factor n=1 Tax=Streptomyces sp. NPDC046925 TaxID=3155375 RepID=UPI0033E10C5B